jgi:hypothetical protein
MQNLGQMIGFEKPINNQIDMIDNESNQNNNQYDVYPFIQINNP